MCLGDRFNHGNSDRELQSIKNEGDTHAFFHLLEDIERVIINHLLIHGIASHWAPHNTDLRHNVFTFQVAVIPRNFPSS